MPLPLRTTCVRKRLEIPIGGVLVAIGITAALDANGMTAFSALPLLPLLALFAFLERLPLRSLGFVRGRAADYAVALLYPVIVLGVVGVGAFVVGIAAQTRRSRRGGARRYQRCVCDLALVIRNARERVYITSDAGRGVHHERRSNRGNLGCHARDLRIDRRDEHESRALERRGICILRRRSEERTTRFTEYDRLGT